MKIGLDSGGSYLEPDDGPRDTPHHKRIVRAEPIEWSGFNKSKWTQLTLECGHGVTAIGDLTHAAGVIFCTKCRDLEEA